jgi:acyl carrier protein
MKEENVREEIEKNIRNFIVEEVLEENDSQDLPEDIPLLSGVLDSFGLMSLLSFLEDRYDLIINNNQVVAQNFESIRALTIFVENKLAEKEVAASA